MDQDRQKKKISQSLVNSPTLVSVITVVFNGIDGIDETIASVVRHKNDCVEYIVIDGGSTDGTIELIRKNQPGIDYWISEPDSGIYDGINKGIKEAHGHFFYILNVGDKLIEFPYRELLEAKENQADVALFSVLLSDGRKIESKVDYRLRFGNTIHHQGAFYRKNLDIFYDLTLRVYSDFDINQKLFLRGRKFMAFEKVISSHSLDGISNDRKYLGEYFSVIRRNFGVFWVVVGFLYLKQGELRAKIKKLFHGKPKSATQ